MALSRPIRISQPVAYSVSFAAGTADRNYYFKTTLPLKFESLQYAADSVDSTDKFAVTFSVTDPAGTTRAYCTGAVLTTADSVYEITTLDSTALPGGFIPAGSTLKLFVDVSGTAANIVGATVRVECVVAH